jgi:hypothetical protein
MLSPATVVNLAELRGRGVQPSVAEAVAIVFQLGHRLSWHIAPPPPSSVLLQANGTVDVRWPHDAHPATAASFARLLHDLLPAAGAGPEPVPGGLRLLVARALGDTPLPPIAGGPEFAAALHRFVDASDPDAIAALVGGVVRKAEAAATPRVSRRAVAERRASGPSVSELRRQLQESDLARYTLLARLERGSPAPAHAAVVRIDQATRSRGSSTAQPPAAGDAVETAAVRVRRAAARLLQPPADRRALKVGGIGALAAVLITGVVVDDGPRVTLPAAPAMPAAQHAAGLPALPVPFELLASDQPVRVLEPEQDVETEGLTRVRDVADTPALHKPDKKRQPNKFMRFVKSLFKA